MNEPDPDVERAIWGVTPSDWVAWEAEQEQWKKEGRGIYEDQA